jgi:hypothetical protein
MSLIFQARRSVIFALLALLMPAWAANGLPLVWCVGANGHSAIETLGLGDCHGGSAFSKGHLSVEEGDCTDFALWQQAQNPRQPIAVSPPRPDATTHTKLAATIHSDPGRQLRLSGFQSDSIASQLTQLRTVVLLI